MTFGFGPIIRLGARISAQLATGKGMKDDLGRLVDFDMQQGILRFLEG